MIKENSLIKLSKNKYSKITKHILWFSFYIIITNFFLDKIKWILKLEKFNPVNDLINTLNQSNDFLDNILIFTFKWTIYNFLITTIVVVIILSITKELNININNNNIYQKNQRNKLKRTPLTDSIIIGISFFLAFLPICNKIHLFILVALFLFVVFLKSLNILEIIALKFKKKR